jgi:hypothetical protein
MSISMKQVESRDTAVKQSLSNRRSYFTCIYCEVKQPSRNIKNPVDLLWKVGVNLPPIRSNQKAFRRHTAD